MVSWYQHEIVDAGKQPLAFLFLGFVVTFLFIRFSTRMIRAQVKWWPGNVSPGGLHVHHVVFGIVLMLVAGAGGFSRIGDERPFAEIFGALFGVGAALVLDEFALVLHLRDVYWSEQGRTSVDAVFLAAAVFGLLLLGSVPLGVDDEQASGDGAWGIASAIVVNGGLVSLTLLKGKVWTGLLGVLLPILAFVGAIRLARPHSPWARWRYRPGSRKRERSQRREQGNARWTGRLKRFQDALAGRPS